MTSEWINWAGGEVPIAKGTKFEATLRNGWIKTATVRIIKTTKWQHKGSSKDIMAYRVLESAQ